LERDLTPLFNAFSQRRVTTQMVAIPYMLTAFSADGHQKVASGGGAVSDHLRLFGNETALSGYRWFRISPRRVASYGAYSLQNVALYHVSDKSRRVNKHDRALESKGVGPLATPGYFIRHRSVEYKYVHQMLRKQGSN
jgi:hypothetical protein